MLSGVQKSQKKPQSTVFGTLLPPICLKVVPIYGIFRRFWDIHRYELPNATPTLPKAASSTSKAPSIHYHNCNILTKVRFNIISCILYEPLFVLYPLLSLLCEVRITYGNGGINEIRIYGVKRNWGIIIWSFILLKNVLTK